jgi:hypothetical protein
MAVIRFDDGSPIFAKHDRLIVQFKSRNGDAQELLRSSRKMLPSLCDRGTRMFSRLVAGSSVCYDWVARSTVASDEEGVWSIGFDSTHNLLVFPRTFPLEEE